MAPEKLFDAALALLPEAGPEFASKLLASVEDGPGEDWTQGWLVRCELVLTRANALNSMPRSHAHFMYDAHAPRSFAGSVPAAKYVDGGIWDEESEGEGCRISSDAAGWHSVSGP